MTWALHLGDCLDPITGLASLADKSVDHVICDPPYEAEAHTKQRRTNGGGAHQGTEKKFHVSKVEELDFAPLTEEVRSGAAREIARVVRRWVVIFCQAEAVALWRDCLSGHGLAYKRAGIWVKPDGMPQYTGDRPGMGYESIVFAHATGKSRWNGGGKHGVYVFNRGNGGAPNEHPTQKPQALMEALVADMTDPGETILDPFAGSGTTGVAAIRLGRNFIGWEKDPKYHAIATKRLEGTREQLSLLGPRTKAKQGALL